jgi:hypothetical protein
MDCEERDRLRTIHLDAVKGWTEAGGGNPMTRSDPTVAGGGNPMTRSDPTVVAAWAKVVEAQQAIFGHRKTHGC